ncbi:hypothetical protein BME18_23815 [Klebsiella michiganensis]|uniref:DUF4282 domain-containing protein n=1 Tax=Klebsiella pasteurii TaxID=2587529 RepID=UPI000B62BA0D|nr:DUF4282 domain-containing protein [Klebsiella grimontii]OVU30808.1 hypothetical protein BME18_23815 [Klebsiella michiganensis]
MSRIFNLILDVFQLITGVKVKDLLGFDHLITPRVLVFLYWLLMVLILVGGVFSMFSGQFITGFFGTIFSLIGCRVMFELIMVAFKNNEYLRRIAESSEQSK